MFTPVRRVRTDQPNACAPGTHRPPAEINQIHAAATSFDAAYRVSSPATARSRSAMMILRMPYIAAVAAAARVRSGSPINS